MKYCSECGNQLLDEAVICPKCGAAAGPIGEKETPAGKHDKRVRLKTSAALNNIAGILNLLLALFFTWILFGSSSVESGSSEGFTISVDTSGCAPHPALFWLWLASILFTYALALYSISHIQRGGKGIFAYLYMFSSILSVLLLNLAFPNLLILAMCFIGVIFFVPTILQLIAGVKMLQGTR